MAEAVQTQKRGGGIWGIGLVLLLALGAVLLLLMPPSARVDTGPVGLAGLTPWLQQNDVEAVQSHRMLSPRAEELSLRVLPVYDIDPGRHTLKPRNREERIARRTLRDLPVYTLNRKLRDVPTLVLLPKWNGAMAELRVAHAQSLLDPADLQPLRYDLELHRAEIIQLGAEFTTIDGAAMAAPAPLGLFHAQLLRRGTLPAHCTELLGTEQGALLIHCTPKDFPAFHLLSDPDLLNNHGLAVAGNARFAPLLLRQLIPADRRAEGGAQKIYVDLLDRIMVDTSDNSQRRDYERGWEEIARYFTYPFNLLWGGALMLLALLAWRGAVRFGPVVPQAGGMAAGAAGGMAGSTGSGTGGGMAGGAAAPARNAALAAKARALRLVGQDGRLVADFIRGERLEMGRRMFGPTAGWPEADRAMAALARRDADLAQDYSAVMDRLQQSGNTMSPAELTRQLSFYQTLRKKVMDTHGT